MFSAVASGGDGTGASFAAAGLLSGRPISGEPGGSVVAAGAGVAAGAAAGADGAEACGGAICCAEAAAANKQSVPANSGPADTSSRHEILPGAEVRSRRLPLPAVSDISTPACNQVRALFERVVIGAVARASNPPIGVGRPAKLLLAHTKIESTVRYLGIPKAAFCADARMNWSR